MDPEGGDQLTSSDVSDSHCMPLRASVSFRRVTAVWTGPGQVDRYLGGMFDRLAGLHVGLRPLTDT